MSACLRVGGVPYLNGRPLTAWFEEPACDAPVELRLEVPSRLAKMLDRGELDVAMVSSIEAFRTAGKIVVPDMAIAADGPVRSVRLFSRVPLPDIRTLATDNGSLTSVALAQIILKLRYGIQPELTSIPPEPEVMLQACDAALLIGDRALMGVPTPHTLDLGAAWREHTGLPFVFAVWMMTSAERTAEAWEHLAQAKAWGVTHRQEIAEAWANKTGIPVHVASDYILNIMRYDLGDRERMALERFAELCSSLGIVQKPFPICYGAV
jgi:chorismate dehydratase